jgi:hypothetical protein
MRNRIDKVDVIGIVLIAMRFVLMNVILQPKVKRREEKQDKRPKLRKANIDMFLL